MRPATAHNIFQQHRIMRKAFILALALNPRDQPRIVRIDPSGQRIWSLTLPSERKPTIRKGLSTNRIAGMGEIFFDFLLRRVMLAGRGSIVHFTNFTRYFR